MDRKLWVNGLLVKVKISYLNFLMQQLEVAKLKVGAILEF
jgi:hypothetical protein